MLCGMFVVIGGIWLVEWFEVELEDLVLGCMIWYVYVVDMLFVVG